MEMREKIARALAPLAWAALGTGDTLAHKNRRTSSLRHADAALAALGETHVLAPREPTEEMLAAGFGACVAEWPDEQCRAELPHIYRAMLAAAKEGE